MGHAVRLVPGMESHWQTDTLYIEIWVFDAEIPSEILRYGSIGDSVTGEHRVSEPISYLWGFKWNFISVHIRRTDFDIPSMDFPDILCFTPISEIN